MDSTNSDMSMKFSVRLPGFSLWQRIRFLLGLSATSRGE